MLLLALAVFPVAAAVLALQLARALAPGERAVVAGSTALFAVSALLAPQEPIHDAWTHFLHLRAAGADPVWLLDGWDRPGFTLLFAPPAALGLTAARLAAAIPAAVALGATMRAARALRLERSWAAGLLLVAQYDFFGQASSTMTELPCAAALAVAVWGWAEKRPWVVAAGAGWAAITRPEGPLFAGIAAAGLLARGSPGPALAALAPFPLYLAAGALAWRDPLWLIHGNPYRELIGLRLELGQLARSFFFEALRRGQPPVLLALEAIGAGLAIAGRPRRLRFLLAPLAASFAVLTFLRIGPTDGWRESRYLVAVAPALALLAAGGLDAILARFPRAAPPALLLAAAAGAAGILRWHWREVVPPGAGSAGVYAGLVGAALLLWLARRRVPPRLALAVLLLVPLAAAPPGAHGNHRSSPGPDRAAAEVAPGVVPARR
jgi:hypothetical protein